VLCVFFFFNDTATTEIYTLSLHDALPISHAGVEELYLLDGELFIDGRKLYPGDYNRAEVGTGDQSVWSETGCTCVLLTSSEDVLR